MAVIANGRIPASLLAAVPDNPGCLLVAGAAASFDAVADEVERLHGWRPRITSAGDAFRSEDRQETVFRQRYRLSYALINGRMDMRWWDGDGDGIKESWYRWHDAAAAVPGTSNHGWATTVDVRGRTGSLMYGTTEFREFAEVAARHGWSNAEGKSVGEAWHWTHIASSSLVSNVVRTGNTNLLIPTVGGLPAPIAPEDDIVASIEDLRTVVREELSAADVLEALDLKTGFRFSCQGAVYFASLVSGAYYWVPGGDQPHHTQLINLEVREIGEVLPVQRDTISSLCERAKLSFLAPAVAAAPDAATIAAAIPADLAKQVADELAHRLTNGA